MGTPMSPSLAPQVVPTLARVVHPRVDCSCNRRKVAAAGGKKGEGGGKEERGTWWTEGLVTPCPSLGGLTSPGATTMPVRKKKKGGKGKKGRKRSIAPSRRPASATSGRATSLRGREKEKKKKKKKRGEKEEKRRGRGGRQEVTVHEPKEFTRRLRHLT